MLYRETICFAHNFLISKNDSVGRYDFLIFGFVTYVYLTIFFQKRRSKMHLQNRSFFQLKSSLRGGIMNERTKKMKQCAYNKFFTK